MMCDVFALLCALCVRVCVADVIAHERRFLLNIFFLANIFSSVGLVPKADINLRMQKAG